MTKKGRKTAAAASKQQQAAASSKQQQAAASSKQQQQQQQQQQQPLQGFWLPASPTDQQPAVPLLAKPANPSPSSAAPILPKSK
ncbi:hypothetical protein DIPPA_19301 [Diplonema papillatum]|nr:hypothetical protein DIPPA_19301 [Diplonema papillatum]